MRTLLALALGWALLACSSAPSPSPSTGTPPDTSGGTSSKLTVTVLATGQAEAWGMQWPYQLLRLQEDGKAAAYAQWFPPRKEGTWPAMLLTRPYDGISWTGEAVDAKWAARGAGLHPDDSEPHYHEGSSVIAYAPVTPEAVAAESFFFLYHDFGVLAVFGRFYAGGDLQNDVDDMHAGFSFLAQAPGVDRSRVGIHGGSWGGFEALYAAASAPAEVRPRVGVALYPLSDFTRQQDYLSAVVPSRVSDPVVRSQYSMFFEPYLRRVFATTGGTPGASGVDSTRWTHEYLAAAVDTPFLVIHEDWDSLIPVEQTRELASRLGQRLTPLYFQHPGAADWDTRALDHGVLVSRYGHTLDTLATSHLLTRLGGDTQPLYVPVLQSSLVEWLREVRALQASGRDVSDVAPRLRELTDPRVTLVELSDGNRAAGVDWVAAVVNAVWGTQYTRDTLRDALASGLPR
ncbi:S9 family peptidase [Myxococcus sp. K15C18031901]|uniref:alpha/beta hydrolase family protein n=1 Tax=Myxococcus dinghuensis TaxID=2906761 RepID=UPI0020A70D14|nr:prolyl oligopeptidase family serine peptidase [Myxococcus dinghuensis]MCP3104589.1 S9 family peptidase [Myxococcus dinghuensis]